MRHLRRAPTCWRYDFGCAVGDHSNHVCFVTLEAESELGARRLVAGPVGDKAWLVEVGKFTEAQIGSYHAA
jgi:hypothetical protein